MCQILVSRDPEGTKGEGHETRRFAAQAFWLLAQRGCQEGEERKGKERSLHRWAGLRAHYFVPWSPEERRHGQIGRVGQYLVITTIVRAASTTTCFYQAHKVTD